MTSLLASVTGPAEAAIALDAGADIIDLKDPSAGALGAVPEAVVRATVRAVVGRRPVGAVTGDLPPDPRIVVAAAEAMAATGVDYVKIGLFGREGAADCIAALAGLARRTRLVAVLFADRAPDFSLLPSLADFGFHAVMLDTADKSGKRLLDHLDIPALARFVAAAHGAGLRAGLAGALEAPDVPRLLVLRPDILGFRGALCAVRRTGAMNADATRAIRALIPREGTAEPPPAVNSRLLAARFHAPEPDTDRAVTDRVFVRDFILPVSIGAYAFEHEAKQRVSFDVEAVIIRSARPARDIADIFSYDLITDGIRLLVDSGHFALAETLAERIAAVVLAHPRVLKATVRVTKLDVGHGALGVEIERQRQAAQPASADVTPLPLRG